MNTRLTFLLVLLPFLATATQIKTGERINLQEPTTENTLLLGGEIDVNHSVDGDLTALGGAIHLRDVMRKDGLIAGGEIKLEGTCEEDLRILGGDITLREPVMGDLLIIGGDISLEAGAEVSGDLLILGGNVEVASPVKGDVKIRGGEVAINGAIGGRLDLAGGRLYINGQVQDVSLLKARYLELGDAARFNGDVRYWRKAGELDFTKHLAAGVRANYDPELESELMALNWEEVRQKGLYWTRLFQVISGLFLLLVLYLVLRGFLRHRTGNGRKLAVVSSVYGLAALLGLPILSVLAFVSIVGAPIGVVGFSIFVILASIANALAAILVAFEWQKYKGRDWNNWTMLGIAGSAFLLMRLLAFMPVVGTLVNTLLSIWAVGYLLVLVWGKQHPNTPKTPTADNTDWV